MTPLRSVSALLEELYAIDPGLRVREDELVPLIERLLAERPDVTPDAHFVAELRAQLLRATPPASSPSYFSFLTMQRFSPLLAGLMLGILVAAPATYVLFRGGSAPSGDTPPLFSYAVTKDASRSAFGDLRSLPAQTGVTGRGGGGGGGGMAAPAAESKIAPDILPVLTQVEYVYDGKLPDLPASVDVLQRQKAISGPGLSSVIRSMNLGMVDLTSFPNSTINTLIFTQDVDFGYTVNVMFGEGQIGLSQNWARWPHPESSCQNEECFKRYRTTIADIPSDDQLITIARDFVTAHGIDLSHYGAPEVDDTWKADYERTVNKDEAYIPDTIRVLFPQIVDGKPVVDLGGMKTGIAVSVHAKLRRVSDVWGMQSQNYRSSAYEGVTDPAAIAAYLKNVEKMPPEYRPVGQKSETKTAELGEPSLGYAVFYKSDGMLSNELLIPSLIFPVKNAPEGMLFYRKNVAVPLAKDMLQAQGSGPSLMVR